MLREAQRLAWNFTRASLLITLEPHRVQAWTCALAPKKGKTQRKLDALRAMAPLSLAEGEKRSNLLQSDAAQVLHWVNLVSGDFVKERPSKFRKEERADAKLVGNLRAVRAKLLATGMEMEVCHSLLARLIFTQFLFQRRDSEGKPAITQRVLEGRFGGSLKKAYPHDSALQSILRDKSETYALFQWLNAKFNGDLFTGKGTTEAERKKEWEQEKDAVSQDQLDILADFISGEIDLGSGQTSLWPEYSFDALPLEFISSVYEEFLGEKSQKETSAYYTPSHLVDFVLDGVLPWGGTEWKLRILDPCCGSGIFLVKSFQRLVQRWRNAHPGVDPKADDLRAILNQLMGVDRNTEAVRVAAFSLCLAMCDEIDPRQYWKSTLFPPLRGHRLIGSDFFSEEQSGFRTETDSARWDLIVGNAPWKSGGLEEDALAVRWAEKHGWPVADRNVGPLFLSKAASLCKPAGTISLILPAMPLLYHRSTGPTLDYRRKLFGSCTIEEVVSFTHLRAYLFPGISARACLMTLRPTPCSGDTAFTYICPKPQGNGEDDSLIAIDPQDVHTLTHAEAVDDPIIWSALLVGGRRDWRLVKRLRDETTLGKLVAKAPSSSLTGQCLITREGIIRGKTKQRDERQIKDRKILESPNFPPQTSLLLNGEALPPNTNLKIHERDSTNFDAFAIPQLLIKQTVIKETGRFRAALVQAPEDGEGVIATQSYLTVHQFKDGDGWLRSACLALNSRLATYFGLLSSSRLVANRAEALSGDILDIPLPPVDRIPPLEGLSLAQVDEVVEKAFSLTEAESALVADLLDVVYRDGGKQGHEKPGRSRTKRARDDDSAGELHEYADFIIKSLRATFGKSKAVRVSIFEEEAGTSLLPLRMVAIHLEWPNQRQRIKHEVLNSKDLSKEMARFFKERLGIRSRAGESISAGIGFQRVARLFITHEAEDGTKVPTVLMLKPDQRRYWTRSQALRDADELALTIQAAGATRRTKT
ncbi:MAG: N-6 DNA methylase [Opitutales bacterium]|nr:N-6 DNA methylase [Opitutales bacterium]